MLSSVDGSGDSAIYVTVIIVNSGVMSWAYQINICKVKKICQNKNMICHGRVMVWIESSNTIVLSISVCGENVIRYV